jgi:Fe2+ transport system protein FeoA
MAACGTAARAVSMAQDRAVRHDVLVRFVVAMGVLPGVDVRVAVHRSVGVPMLVFVGRVILEARFTRPAATGRTHRSLPPALLV